MSAQVALVKPERKIADVSVRIVTDPAAKSQYPGLPDLYVAVHVGKSVYMDCSRGGRRHSGLGVHGDIDIIPPLTPAVWEPRDEDTALVVGLQPNLLKAVAEESGLRADRMEVLNRFQIRDQQLEGISWALKAEMEAGYPSGLLFRESLGWALAAGLVSRHSSQAKITRAATQGMSGRRLKEVLTYIEDNLGRDLSLEEIAAVARISASHCKSTFRKTIGVPIHQYIIRRRVERARVLLSETVLPISQIAQDTGFAHQSHLAAQMQRVLGCSPKAFRSFDHGVDRPHAV